MGVIFSGVKNKWKLISGRVAPAAETPERQIQFVGDGFYIEDIFEHIIDTVREGKEGNGGGKQKKTFRAVANVSRLAAKTGGGPRPARKKFTFKSMAKVSRFAVNNNNNTSVEKT